MLSGESSRFSRTALATALMGAAHTRLDPHPLIDDPWGDRLVPETAKRAMAPSEELLDESLLRNRSYANVIMRTRYAEDALHAAVCHGVQQYVLIGAGFDSFALRRPDYCADLRIFEIGLAATQRLKIERIEACGITLPDTVQFVAADFSQESLAEALARSPFDTNRLTLFSWLGVTMYLTRDANLSNLELDRLLQPGRERGGLYLSR